VGGLDAPVTQITAGYNHTCALTNAGAIQCWGANTNGQLGAESSDRCGDFDCSVTPIAVTGVTGGVSAAAAGFAHTCAITSDGGLKCWGFNLYGQLGDGTTTDRTLPEYVSGVTEGVAAVAPGDVQTCALMNDGTVRCWGNNLLGELGDGTRTTSLTPVTVCRDASCSQPLDDIVQLSGGDYHTCALNASGEVFCWGSDLSGQLGITTPQGCPDSGHLCSTVPARVTGLSGPATAVSASTASTCALLTSGAVECWGQVFGSRNVWTSPTPIDGWQSGVESIAAANDHACAVTNDGELLCFGKNNYGQLGDGTSADRDQTLPGRVWLLSDRGDADCDGTISSRDALVVLQLVAELISSLPCPNAAATVDQQVTSIDALAILQFSAGLLT
jgi:alpha-tubulin suppressor-like RCC1 family protein